MDAKRYQQIQDIFWKAEELPQQDQESFVRESAGDDYQLIDEVLSLLREHDADAALLEGRSVQPVRLPGSTKIGIAVEDRQEAASYVGGEGSGESDRPDIRKTVPMDRPDGPPSEFSGKPPSGANASGSGKAPTTKKGPKGDSRRNAGQRTVGGSQRTHAAPRHPKTPREKRKRRPGSDSRVPANLPTSIGPKRFRFSWLPLWIAIVLSALVPIWFAAWTIGSRQIEQEELANHRLLSSVLERSRLQFESLLSTDRQISERIALEASEGAIVQDGSPGGDASHAPTVLNAFMANQDQRERDETTFIIWDRTFRIVAKSTPHDVPDEFWTARYAGPVSRCLEHQSVFIGPATRHSLNSQGARDVVPDHGDGWMFPIKDHDNPEDVLGVVLITRHGLRSVINAAFEELSLETGVDVYLVDRQGIMQTESRWVLAMRDRNELPNDPNKPFRVAEYTPLHKSAPNSRQVQPLTVAAASVSTNRGSIVYPSAYPSYHGGYTSGASVWLPACELGMIAEIPVQRYVSAFSLTWPGALLGSLLACGVASAVTWWHQSKIHSITDARQPLGRYEIRRELGSGGMGVVYLARHKELSRDIALKVLRGDRQDEDDRQRFDREARLAASLSCPHSVTVYDFGYTADDSAFCVMELLHGLTLAEVVARGGAQPPGRVVWIMQQICQSMLEAHGKGLMHRDLKPQNVMLRFDSIVGDWATVFDFGLAKPIEPDHDVFQTSETVWAGTPMYMAPERFRDPSSMDPRSDIYSIGCIAYYLLAGNPPFAECDPESMFALIMSEHPISIATHRSEAIDDRLNHWVNECMRKDKRSRAESIPELIRSLQEMSDDMPWNRSDADTWWTTHAPELHG
ncbi:serine/threonine-protein kinase [Aporhodopirellula aestuarii]|uniref:Protein kinase n=1 Tax=Aporhodopirellula aestuarii TaxID=2950107 RepID=A0ABT0U0J0_9BACT|nr:serine/threonine-protein kinase [Aporhodopirellula aestuarii]MCM2370013.1 protein kinase [Aporhodopirellula aestuarii]